MNRLTLIVGLSLVLLVLSSVLLATIDSNKYTLRAPNGLSFGLIKGYENWHMVASHYRTDKKEIHVIVGNDKAIRAYATGSGKDEKPFPNGTILVKIGYSLKENPAFPSLIEPDKLQRVEYMVKDSKRFNDTGNWGYARFVYNTTSSKFAPYGKGKTFATECYSCHLSVEKKDFIFTDFISR